MTWAFKTGRQYSADGQRIAMTIIEDGRVFFVDIDRYISGFTHQRVAANHPYITDWLMRQYDDCSYDGGNYDCVTLESYNDVEKALQKLALTA